MVSKKAILVGGPTASGKSKFAAALAHEKNGVIINADSMQVYKELHILTARPTPDEEATVPHRLYGFVSAVENYSVAKWLDKAKKTIEETNAAGQLPIIVGGTGLYFNALTHGLSPIPEIPDETRARWRTRGESTPSQELHRELGVLDPLTARILRPTDKQRLVRALEVFEATGRPLAEWQKKGGTPVLAPDSWNGYVIDRPREDIYQRCEDRFDAMMQAGALAETQCLLSMQLASDLPAMRALGVPSLMSHLRGEISLEDAICEAKRDTRRYVKRQLTWLRQYMISWNWISTQ